MKAADVRLTRRMLTTARRPVGGLEPDEARFLAAVDARLDAPPAGSRPWTWGPVAALAGAVAAVLLLAVVARHPAPVPETAHADRLAALAVAAADAEVEADVDLEAIMTDPELAADLEAAQG